MKRRRRKPSVARKILWFFLLILAFTSLRTWYIQEQESHILEQERQQYQAQIDLLDAEIERLRNTLENITDDEHIEAMARKNLRMVNENEWVLIDIQKGKD